MNTRKNILITFGFVLSVSFITSALTAIIVSRHYSRIPFDVLTAVFGNVLEQEPETERIVSAALKEYLNGNTKGTEMQNVLSSWGYRIEDFSAVDRRQILLLTVVAFLAGISLFLSAFLYQNKIESKRIQALADYLEQANTGKAAILSNTGEDDFSKLEDAIYKTVTFLYQTKEMAVQAKNDFAENLSNIAHQIKTPITSISLSIQALLQEYEKTAPAPLSHSNDGITTASLNYCKLEQIQKQLLRLTHLEEALLLLSKLDAGTLILQKKEIDVFTVLVLAADNLQELFDESKTAIDIPEWRETAITADLDWTMEAMINLMKNCIEHHAGGTIHCSYQKNPLYTEILIWDEGNGFCKEDIPHLFERFYRGKNACGTGIGIGLSLSKEIIERQNGTIRARNMPGGGACFEIRFYCHHEPVTEL